MIEKQNTYNKKYELRHYNDSFYVTVLCATDLKYIYQYIDTNNLNINDYDIVSIQTSIDFLHKSKEGN